MFKQRFCLVVYVFFLSCTSLQAAPIAAVVINGELAGFDNIIAGTGTYNVRFYDGSFNAVFGANATEADLAFTESSDAKVAATALLNAFDLFPAFDDDPTKTVGILTNTGYIWTPWKVADPNVNNGTVTARVLRNTNGGNFNPDAVLQQARIRTTDSNSTIYADWQLTAVPAPAAVWLLGSALTGLGWFRRRQTA